MQHHGLSRRKFLQLSAFATAGVALAACTAPIVPAAAPSAGSSRAQLVQASLFPGSL